MFDSFCLVEILCIVTSRVPRVRISLLQGHPKYEYQLCIRISYICSEDHQDIPGKPPPVEPGLFTRDQLSQSPANDMQQTFMVNRD